MEQVKDQKRGRGKFLSGSRAWSAFESVVNGEDHIVATECGNLSLKVRRGDKEGSIDTSRVDLCRNGMWVSDDLPKLQKRRFSEMQPFHCVILLQAGDKEIHRLVRKSEGPLHNELKARKWLQPKERKDLEAAMEKVHQKLKELLPEFKGESYRFPDVLNVDVHGTSKGGRRRRAGRVNSFSKIMKLPPVRRPLGGEETPAGEGPGMGLRMNTKSSGEGVGGGGGDDQLQKRGPPVEFATDAAQTGERSCIVEIVPQQACEHAVVRFAIDENYDETWEMRGKEHFVNLEKMRIDGEDVAEDNAVREGNRRFREVSLNNLEEGKPVTLEFDFTLPKGAGLPDDASVVLKTQIFKKIQADPEQEEA